MPERLKVLMVAAEAVPFIKTGGLADVIGSLPRALAQEDVDVRIVLPRYESIDLQRWPGRTIGTVVVPFDGMDRSATIYRTSIEVETSAVEQGVRATTANGTTANATSEVVPVYFVDAPSYYRRPELYGYPDDMLRFGFFSRVCLDLPLLLDWHPDIIHCHDWHTGLLPVYLRAGRDVSPFVAATRSIFTIHNLAYQGEANKTYLSRLGLDWSLFNPRQLEFYDQINPLKGALVFADMLTAVSQGYADEIQTVEYGAGLEGVLSERAPALRGILNGLDYEEWDPRRDPYLAQPFGPDDIGGKAACRADLLQRVGLAAPHRKAANRAAHSRKMPVIGMVSRLSAQKGFDITAEALEAMVAMGCYFVLLGSGEEQFIRLFKTLEKRFPNHIACCLGKFDNELAHKIYAGSDMFLMPSHYEPCGLAQMISLAYGTIPVVRATGGLADTVHEFDPKTKQGNGFVFRDYTSAALLAAVARAIAGYQSRAWPQLLKNAFACDFSWQNSARKYVRIYQELTGR